MEVGAAAPPTDVDTTGSSPEGASQPVDTVPDDFTQNQYLQIEGGFLGGLALGIVPFGSPGFQALEDGGVIDPGTLPWRRGLAVGQIVGGLYTALGGVTGTFLGGALTATGPGAAAGVPAIVASVGVVIGGLSNIATGVHGLSQVMMASGLGSTASTPVATPQPTGFRPFTRGNFRHNLIQRTGGAPKGAQAHHVLPAKFEAQFGKAGLNIHEPKFGTWWEKSAHLKSAAQYNAQWQQFLNTNPTQTQIIDFAREIAGQYGLTILF